MTASIRPETLGCALGVPGGAQGDGKVTFISEQWMAEIRSDVFESRGGIGIGMVREERMSGSHFGRDME